MKLQHYVLAKAAVAAILMATVLIATAAFSQSKAPANGPEPDPNMPVLPYAIPGAPITWSPRGSTPIVSFRKPAGPGSYLGFNEKGTWIRNEWDRKVYVWNLKDKSLTLGAESDAGVPLDLRNPSPDMKDLIANATGHGSAGVTSASTKGRNTPYIPPSVAGDGNAQHTGSQAAVPAPKTPPSNPMGTSRPFKGTGASIKAGVLTFLLDDPSSPDNGKPMSLKVVRSPMNNPNAAKPNGIAGAWIGEDPRNTGVVFSLFVQGESGPVSGNAMTGLAAEALKKMMSANQR